MRDKGRMRFDFDSCRQLCDQKTYKTVIWSQIQRLESSLLPRGRM